MKCPRCGSQMNRRQLKEHTYVYVCPKCKQVIGGREKGNSTEEAVDLTEEAVRPER